MGGQRDDEDFLRLAVESAPSGILVADAEGCILLVNREVERLFDFTRDQLIGKPVEFLIPERFTRSHPSHRSGYLAAPVKRPMGAGRDLFGRRRDGSEVAIEIGLNPVHTEHGLVVLASIVDISARRRLEGQLRQAQRMEAIGTLVGGIAHDFNNVLLGIVGFAELAHAAARDRPQLAADLDQIMQAAERGRQLVSRILDFTREREVARRVLQPEPVVREALKLLRATLPATIDLRHDLDPATPSVMADESELHQIIMNLVTNAAQAVGVNPGSIRTTLDRFTIGPEEAEVRPGLPPGLYARLRVADDGAGMPPEVTERAFEPFFTTKGPGHGTGLGLSMVHGIVKACGGAVTIDSREGLGTTVEVLLPRAGLPAAGAAAEITGTGPRRHILLVEDEAILAAMERRLLESLGYRATVFTSSRDALDHFRSRPGDFDLMMTDNSMPELSGLDLAQEVARLRPGLPILMVSGIGEILGAQDLRRLGIGGVLRKPHRLSELTEALKGLLGEP